MIDCLKLGRPSAAEERCLKDRWCDTFIKADGTKVQPTYEPSKTLLNIYDVDDYENVTQFSFGKSYTELDNLYYYYDRVHGIDLSRTDLDETSFEFLYLANCNLSSFSLPQSLTSIEDLNLRDNQMTSFSLPESLRYIWRLQLDANYLSSFILPDSLTSFTYLVLGFNNISSFTLPNSLVCFTHLNLDQNNISYFTLPSSLSRFAFLYLNSNCSVDMTHITDITQIPTITDDRGGIFTDNSKSNTVIKIKDASMEPVFKSKQYWEDYRYVWDGKPAEKVMLTVHKAYDSDPGSQAQIFIDDVEKEFDVAYEFDKGATFELKAFPPETYAVEKFLYWSDDPTHSTYSSVRQMTMNSNVELTAMFHANVS